MPAPRSTRSGAEVFRAEEITLPRPGGGRAVDEVSLSLRAGEIVGIYGLMGAGRTELFEVHHGAAPACDRAVLPRRRAADGEGRGGADRAGDRADPGGPQGARDDPDHVGAGEHVAGVARRLHPRVPPDLAAEAARVRDFVRELAIKVASPENPISALSGGNQQKVVIGKALMTQAEGAADGRAVARHRRGREGRGVPHDAAAGGGGARDPVRDLGPRGGDVAVGPDPRDVERPDHRRVRGRQRRTRRRSSPPRRSGTRPPARRRCTHELRRQRPAVARPSAATRAAPAR